MDYDPKELVNAKNWASPIQNAEGMWQISFLIKLVTPPDNDCFTLLKLLLQSGSQFVQKRYMDESEYLKANDKPTRQTYPHIEIEIESCSNKQCVELIIISDEHPIHFCFFPCYDFMFSAIEEYVSPITSIQNQETHIWKNLLNWP